MKFVIYIFILIENIFITIEQTNINNGTNIKDNNDKSKIKQFLFHLGLLLLFIISFYIIVRITIKCCRKRYAFQKLYLNFINNKLIDDETIEQVKYLYGFDYIISFLKEKVFISCKYKDKYDEIKNCGNCSICLSGFELNHRIFITQCNHVYHKKCMTDYIDLIIKQMNPEEKEIENFHDHFHCPNCKEYLYLNKSFIQNMNNNVEVVNDNNIEEMNIDNIQVEEKATKINIGKFRHNIRINNIITTDNTSKRPIHHKKKKKKFGFKKKINKNKKDNQEPTSNNDNKNDNRDDIIVNKKLPNVEMDPYQNYQSNMKLKDNLEMGKNNKISYQVIRSHNNKINPNADKEQTSPNINDNNIK